MIKEILFLSVDQMKAVRPNLATVVVSILDRSEASYRPRLANFRSVLTLSFEDTYEELKLAKPGSWPDEPTPEEHARFAQGRGEEVPTLTDAQRIADFVRRHHAASEPLTLIAHCYGGVSRSAAVAHWANEICGAPLGNEGMKTTEHANKRLLRLLAKTAVPPQTPA